MISIIDYGAGNIRSVEKAFSFLGCNVEITSDIQVIKKSEKIVLPGVGSFGSAFSNLKESGLIPVIKEAIADNKPFFGICLGYQMLFDGSEEDGGIEGLGIFQGDVKRFPQTEGFTIPQIGWNSLNLKKESKIFDGLANESYVYFVHSYYVESKDRNIVSSTTNYILDFDSSISSGNIYGCQFHPEKSSDVGLSILKNFLR